MVDVAELTQLAEAGDAQALAAALWEMPLEELQQLAQGEEKPDGV